MGAVLLGSERFLVDAGSGVRAQLMQAGVRPYTQPDGISRMAAGADARKLVISHLMPRSVAAELQAAAARHYAGPVVVGEDLLEI